MMFLCEKNFNCCNYKRCNSIDQVDEDGYDCEYLTEVDVVRHGRWIFISPSENKCSECNEINEHKSKYCPNCGAIIDK